MVASSPTWISVFGANLGGDGVVGESTDEEMKRSEAVMGYDSVRRGSEAMRGEVRECKNELMNELMNE